MKAGGSKMLSESVVVFHSHNMDENSYTVDSTDRSAVSKKYCSEGFFILKSARKNNERGRN